MICWGSIPWERLLVCVEGLVVRRSYGMQRQDCVMKRGILINEQMGE